MANIPNGVTTETINNTEFEAGLILNKAFTSASSFNKETDVLCATTGGIKVNVTATKQVIKFNEYLDDTNVTEFKLIPTYKRMCICIMKNDHLCKYMGFSPTKEETKKRQDSIAKYKNIIRGK